MKQQINVEYEKILDYCRTKNFSDNVIIQSEKYEKGKWKSHLTRIQAMPISFNDKVVVDFGCKYGHILPLFITIGAAKAIGIDVEPDYVETGKQIFEHLYSNIEILQSDSGYMPLQPESVDFVFMNEVISHINPALLETVYSEIARILKIDGIVYIADGNNAANKICREKLLSFYEKWEKGPDGVETDRDVVLKSYLTRRKEIILNKYPDLEKEKAEYAALNTSGLWGDYLIREIDKYIATGELIERPYRKGICPTNPSPSGVMIENSFYPEQVLMTLKSYGLECRQFNPALSLRGKTWKGKLKALYLNVKDRILSIMIPHYRINASENFKVIGKKIY